jgi:uncharacterized protein YfaS (alpha-2-macroglobulin family)
MKKKWIIAAVATAVLAIAAFFVYSKLANRRIYIDPGFSEYITAFTSGTVSVQSPIRIELANDMESVEVNAEIDKKLFSFSPSLRGKAYWIDKRTIEFRPDKPLEQGTRYVCSFYLKKLMDVPRKFRVFKFDFNTIRQSVAVEFDGYQPYILTKLDMNNITGVLRTADVADDSAVEKILTPTQNGNPLKVRWVHNGEEHTHKFTIDSVVRAETAGEVKIDWDGSPIGSESNGTETVKIPSIFDFLALEANVEQLPQQYVSIRFSDPLDTEQDLSGLITIDNTSDLTFEVDRMTIKVYPSAQQTGSATLTVHQGIRNIAGGKLKKEQQFQVSFESIKPAVRFPGKGTILPNSQGLILPFEAVNIKAVDLRIIKIYADNVSQFLQVNQLDGSNELKRAGRLILKKTIRLDSEKPIVFNRWNTFSLDLSKLIEQEPGAIYRVQLSFKKEYSTYPCAGKEADYKESNMALVADASEDIEGEMAYWDSPSNYYDGDYDEYGYDYNWEEREDPCSNSYYYGSNATASRNVLASNLGIIAKGGADNTLTVAVADLVTTKPRSGVEIEVYDFQRQKMAVAKTDGDGFCSIPLKSKPFLLVAKDGKERGYLRVDDGTCLSLSNFDISGETVQKGLKGFIYGERGVWRPGDTVYLTFILEDKLKKLPANHPVILEIMNPLGQLYKKIVKTNSQNGFYTFTFNTSDTDPTGNWQAYIKIGGITFSKTLKIETVKPNRLKIFFDFGSELLKGASAKATLSAKWLHGAPARNLKADVAVTLSQISTSFKGYDAYVFDDPSKKFETDEQNVFSDNLNDDGNATVNATIETGTNAPGMLRANFVTRVYEPGGEFSIDRLAVTYSPYNAYVGLKVPESDYGYLYTDTNQIFEVATLSPEGKPLSRQNLEVQLFKLEWRWWWDSEGEQLANYVSGSYAQVVFNKTVSTTNGKGRFTYRLNYPEWGRYLVRVTDPVSGHSTGKIIFMDWPGWRGRADRGDSKGATMLTFSSDKKSYKVGDKATITVPSSAGGRMLVSLETGSEVLKTWWEETKAGQTKASFEITDKMAPNIYIHVSLIQPHGQTANDLPIRLYGVIPAAVENPATHLTPVITMPDVLRPEKSFTVKVSEKNNNPMTYTLAIVDEGLLDITRFKTPDPWTAFYGREALGVKTWDLYDYVMGAYGGKVESLFAVGGDGELKNGAGQKANRFKPVVKVIGPFTLNSGINKHEITLPQYIGSVKVMVVAGKDGAFGNAEKAVPVRMPLMVLATLPRVLGPGETVNLPVTLFAMEKNIKNVSLQVVPNEFLHIEGASNQNLSIKEIGETDLSFKLKVASREGVGKVKVIARSGSEKAEYDIEIQVRNPNPKLVKTFEASVDAGRSATIDYELVGISGTNSAMLEVSSIPAINLGRRLQYLLEYPYGCVEQTTSGAFPQLFLDKFTELDDQAQKRRSSNINAAIQRLNSMMVSDGGFGYWPGATEANEWGSSYAGHFLLEAEKLGYTLPSGFKKNWLKYQRKMARNWQPVSSSYYAYEKGYAELKQAYRLYTLALAGEPEMGAMNRLKETSGLSVVAAWRLAASYALAGQKEVGKEIIHKAGSKITPNSRFNETFGSDERDQAMMLETLTLLGDRSAAFTWLKIVAASLSSDNWYSTQTTAYELLAVAKFVGEGGAHTGVKYSFSDNGKAAVRVDTRLPMAQNKIAVRAAGPGKVTVNNTSGGTLFVRVITEGIPETGQMNAYQNSLAMNVVFKNTDGGRIDITSLKQGTDFVAEVTVRNTYTAGSVTNMALRHIFPSGWEITNSRMDNEGISAHANSDFTYQDIRDDRVYTFFDLELNQSKTFTIRLSASYAGRFWFPGTLCESMYEAGVNAFEPGLWVEVVK